MDTRKFMQEKDGWCGPAALQFALHQQGVTISQEELARRTGTTVKGGVDPEPLEKEVEKLGLDTVVIKGKPAQDTLAMIKFYLNAGWSGIVDFLDGDHEYDGHYVVIRAIDKDGIAIFDPSEGRGAVTLKRAYFIDHWLDYKDDGKTFRHYALLLHK